MNIAGVVDTVTNTLNSARIPAGILPPMLLMATSMTRPGLSAYKIATEVIQNNDKLGIPSSPNPDGSENLINAYTYNIIKAVVEALKYDAAIQLAIPMQSLVIQATGANAGGPVTCVGTNITSTISQGIIQ
jgi:hypothetical protein